MSLLVYGSSYRTAPLERLERLAFSVESIPKALDGLVGMPNILEGVILSTCNRVEIYAKVAHFHGGITDIKNFIADFRGVEPAEMVDSAYLFYDEMALRHLFRVASGLDSMVLGESEILGQVKQAIENSRKAGASGRVLGRAFQRAVEVGKLVRHETAISENASSVSAAAVRLASERLGGLEGRRVAVVGAGTAGQAAARALVQAGCSKVYVVNRRPDTAQSIAKQIGGEAVRFGDLPKVVDKVEIMITSTRAPGMVISYEDVESFAESRSFAPLLIVDIAVPRDVDPQARDIQGVEILDLEDLEAVASEGRQLRAKEAEKAAEIVESELERFLIDLKVDEYRQVIALLSARFEEILETELSKAARKAGADPEKLEIARMVARSVSKKILHLPVSRLKGAAASDKGEVLAEALAYLFELDRDTSQD
jgi:glutamyl-tRNA reductase